MSCHVMSCHVMSCHVMSCHVMSCHVMSCHVMSCHVMSCHVMSCHVMSCHVMSCHVMSCHDACDESKNSSVTEVFGWRDHACAKVEWLVCGRSVTLRHAASLMKQTALSTLTMSFCDDFVLVLSASRGPKLHFMEASMVH